MWLTTGQEALTSVLTVGNAVSPFLSVSPHSPCWLAIRFSKRILSGPLNSRVNRKRAGKSPSQNHLELLPPRGVSEGRPEVFSCSQFPADFIVCYNPCVGHICAERNPICLGSSFRAKISSKRKPFESGLSVAHSVSFLDSFVIRDASRALMSRKGIKNDSVHQEEFLETVIEKNNFSISISALSQFNANIEKSFLHSRYIWQRNKQSLCVGKRELHGELVKLFDTFLQLTWRFVIYLFFPQEKIRFDENGVLFRNFRTLFEIRKDLYTATCADRNVAIKKNIKKRREKDRGVDFGRTNQRDEDRGWKGKGRCAEHRKSWIFINLKCR